MFPQKVLHLLYYEFLPDVRDLAWHPVCIDRHLTKALRILEYEESPSKITKVELPNRKRRKGTYPNDCVITFYDGQNRYRWIIWREMQKVKISTNEYELLNYTKEKLVQKIGDGSIINRFDKTPLPTKASSVICPHFNSKK